MSVMAKAKRAANPEMAHWMRELRRSNAAQPHTLKRRKGTRERRARREIREQLDE